VSVLLLLLLLLFLPSLLDSFVMRDFFALSSVFVDGCILKRAAKGPRASRGVFKTSDFRFWVPPACEDVGTGGAGA
jgi:hypothetical protein